MANAILGRYVADIGDTLTSPPPVNSSISSNYNY